jgi:hypothetical protein
MPVTRLPGICGRANRQSGVLLAHGATQGFLMSIVSWANRRGHNELQQALSAGAVTIPAPSGRFATAPPLLGSLIVERM